MATSPSVSVLILTRNEEKDLPGCLESVGWCDDIHVIDSQSEDRTREIARAAGAKVCSNPFASFGAQRNWALDHCEIKHEWVLFLDADERTTARMVEAMRVATRTCGADVAGFYCCWKLMLNGTWLKRSDNFPKWQFRLLRKDRARFTDFGHGQKEGLVDGRLEYLSEPYLHFAFSRGWGHWEAKHRNFARQEAEARLKHKLDVRSLFSPHGSKRNPALKVLVSRLPGWPTIRFISSYFLSGGFLEGREALEYCRRMRWFEQRVQAEMNRIRHG